MKNIKEIDVKLIGKESDGETHLYIPEIQILKITGLNKGSIVHVTISTFNEPIRCYRDCKEQWESVCCRMSPCDRHIPRKEQP